MEDNVNELNLENNKFKNEELITFTDNLYKNFCYVNNDNHIHINYKSFKIISNFFKTNNKQYILNYLVKTIEFVINKHDMFIVHANLSSLTLVDIDKNKDLIQYISIILKERFPNKLDKCYIYEAPFIFSQLFNIISYFIDKKTQQKIMLID